MYWMFDHMEFVLPARTKSEHWPLEAALNPTKETPWPTPQPPRSRS